MIWELLHTGAGSGICGVRFKIIEGGDMYEIKVRNWWVENPEWPNGLEPCATPWAEAYPHSQCDTEAEAIAICKEYNATHRPGRYSRKAEFTEVLAPLGNYTNFHRKWGS